MKIQEPFPGLLLLEPTVYGDERGEFYEAWTQGHFEGHGVAPQFVQGNVSTSRKNVLRGLHYQWPHAQGKLVWVTRGSVYDVAVDVRQGSRTFLQWYGVELSDRDRRALWIPPGFAHGFLALDDDVAFAYLVTDRYDRPSEVSIRWNDPQIGIAWPVAAPILSAKDAAAPLLAELPPDRLPVLAECPSS